jgi:hypothetical protein
MADLDSGSKDYRNDTSKKCKEALGTVHQVIGDRELTAYCLLITACWLLLTDYCLLSINQVRHSGFHCVKLFLISIILIPGGVES